jgi:hypothetical protein
VSGSHRNIGKPALAAGATCAAAVLIWRLFPDNGRFPFAVDELLAVLAFCGLGAALTWRVERARILRTLFVAYAFVCVIAYLVPSNLGGNVARLRYAAVPLALLTFALRRWRPLPLSVGVVALALSWNVTPLAWGLLNSEQDPSANAAYWQPLIVYLHRHLTPSYRVEAVDTVGHWDAFYFAHASIPIVRGWFRQDDFPENQVLYRHRVGRRAYLAWLHELGVRYVVDTDAPVDYSAKAEADLLRSGRSGLRVVDRTAHATIYSVPAPQPIVTGPEHPHVIAQRQSSLTIAVRRRGVYRIAVRYSPYLAPHGGCIAETRSGMTLLYARRSGIFRFRFAVTAAHALDALDGSRTTCSTPR